MSWSEVSPGHFRRPIGENERFIKAIGDRAHGVGREHWSVTAYARFVLHKETLQRRGGDSDQLRRAWKILRFQHPSIASTASTDTNALDYTVPNDPQTLDGWVQETFIVRDNGNVDEVIATFRPSRYVTAHYLPHTSEIILHLAHWRTDGFGALQLVNAFFQAWASSLSKDDGVVQQNLPWGEEVARLVPSVEEALNIPVNATPKIEKATEKYIATLSLAGVAVGLAQTKDMSVLPAGTRSARVRLSLKTTESITKACQGKGISVLSAVHASAAAVTYAFAPPGLKSKPYTSTIRLSLRPHLLAPHRNTPAVAAGIYTGGYMCQVPASQSWLDNAKQYLSEYETGITQDFIQSRRQYAQKVMDRMMKQNNTSTATSLIPPPSEIDISDVGDATKLVQPLHEIYSDGGSIEVVEVGLGVETLTRQMYCFVWIFRGQLEFSLVYNEAFYDAAFAQDVVEHVKRVMVDELDIKD